MKRIGRVAIAVCLSVLVLTSLPAHDVYLMNSNHTDYNWNAPAAAYDAAMLLELDYYLAQIAATSGAPVEEQARYVPDNWWWLYLYETHRSPAQFMQLISAINSGHITVPLNPFVTLYGALPTEAVIRAGYYPGRMEREYGIEFKLAEAIENHTNPWGLASIWAGSGVAYTWKGVCGCAQKAPVRMDDELFIWQGPDNKTLLFKWYELLGSNADWGGYSEARNNLSSPSLLDDEISRTNARQPGISVTGLFGAGWDDVSWESTSVVDAATAYNATATGDTAIVSNGVDFFEALEASNETTLLNVLRGGWGNDWDMWPASLAERTSRVRRSLEQLRTAEMLCVYPQLYDETFWGPVRSDLESGLVSVWKYFEHGWNRTSSGPSLSQMQADKETWAQDMETSVADAITAAETEIRTLFATPDEDRLVVFNPLGFERTDVAQFEMTGTGPWVVTDVTTATEVPSQVYERNGKTYLRFVASQVPSLGHRVYRYTAGPGMTFTDAATVTTGTQTIESGQYRVVLGTRGEIVEATDLSSARQLAGSNGLNDYGTGTITSVVAENVGPVSATLRVDLSGPSRTVRVTLLSGVDRIEVDNAITQNVSGLQTYGFQANLAGSQIRFEEIGAIARPGLETEGGDFLQGTRASRMTLNHFVDFAVSDYHLVISNRDAYAMQVNDSTNSTFDLTGDTVHVVVTDWQQGAGTLDQAGDDLFLNRFALRGIPGVFDGAESMRTALGHQNPFHVVDLPRNQTGPIAEATGSLLSADAANVVVTAIKPAEDHGAGFIVRAWELGGSSSSFDIDASAMGADAAWHTSLIETDVSPASITNGVIQATAGANEIVTYRFTVDVSLLDTDDDGFTPADGDCDDSDPNSFPGAPELCDGNDNDCMGVIPLDEQDQDEDWYVACTGWIDDQGDDPEILGGGDCDDDNAAAFPGAEETCDGEDNDCDGAVDENLNCDQSGEELIGDFGEDGIWTWYDNGVPFQFHPFDSDSAVTGNLDGNPEDELIVDFGSLGMYIYTNNTAWGSQFHPKNLDAMTTGDLDGNGLDELIVDFGVDGIYVYYNGTSWGPKLHAQSPDQMATGDMDGNGRDDLICDFGAAGVWVYYNDTAWGSRLHLQSPAMLAVGDLDGNGLDDVVFDFIGQGVWIYYNNSAWGPRLHALDPAFIAVGNLDGNDQEDLIFDFGSYGIYAYYDNATWSERIHPFATEGIITGDLDGSGRDEMIVAFGTGIGLWGRYNDNPSDWRMLTPSSPETMVTGQLGSSD